MGPTAAAETTVNLTNASFSSVVKAIMEYGDLGDEMSLSEIPSLTCAKDSIIEVIHILYDLTFPDISSLQGSHTLLVRKKKKSGFSFCSNTGSYLLPNSPPKMFLIIYLRNAYALYKSVSQPPGVG